MRRRVRNQPGIQIVVPRKVAGFVVACCPARNVCPDRVQLELKCRIEAYSRFSLNVIYESITRAPNRNKTTIWRGFEIPFWLTLLHPRTFPCMSVTLSRVKMNGLVENSYTLEHNPHLSFYAFKRRFVPIWASLNRWFRGLFVSHVVWFGHVHVHCSFSIRTVHCWLNAESKIIIYHGSVQHSKDDKHACTKPFMHPKRRFKHWILGD